MLLPLVWKDIRLNKYVLAMALFVVDTPYVVTVFFLSAFTGDSEINTYVPERLSIAFPFSLLFLALISAFIGGYPIAAEKSERTDRFLAYLPPSAGWRWSPARCWWRSGFSCWLGPFPHWSTLPASSRRPCTAAFCVTPFPPA